MHARPGSSDGDRGTDDASVGSSTRYGKLKCLPVSFADLTIVPCQGCGAKPNELSEASNASEHDEWNGYHPWNSYTAHPTEPGCKAPRRFLCLICWLTFVVLGLHMVHGTFAKYLASVANKPEEHRKFMRAWRKMWEWFQLGMPSQERKSAKIAALNSYSMILEEERVGARSVRRKTFINLAAWNENKSP